MSLLKSLFGRQNDPPKRIRVCIECGMPIAEHKEWCSILRGQQEMEKDKDWLLKLGSNQQPSG